MRTRVGLWLVLGAGLCGAVVATATVLQVREWVGLIAIAVALGWYAAGFVATRARPDHASALLILGVGAAHLAAYGLVAPLTITGSGTATWWDWTAALVGAVCFALGFVCLASLLSVYPDGSLTSTVQRTVLIGGAVAAVLSSALAFVSSATVPLVVALRDATLRSPAPLPLGGGDGIDLFVIFLLLVAFGLVVLVVRSRNAQGDRRRRLAWVKGAGLLLVLVILGTPAGSWALGSTAWSIVAVGVLLLVPFAFIAGLVRMGSLDVDLLVARSVAYAVVVVVTLSAVGIAAAWLGAASGGASAVAVGVAVAAAVLGQPLRQWLERWIDRWLSGGRLRGHALVRAFADSLDVTGSADLRREITETVASGLDVSWVQIREAGAVVASTGSRGEDRTPAAFAPLRSRASDFGVLECGQRHGGWSETDVALLGDLARSATHALESESMTAVLEERVHELEASRTRLVHAEQTARRGLERDLHDGVQQQLVAVLVRLETLRSLLDPDSSEGRLADLARQQARESLEELRGLVQGLHPPSLSDHGLVSALSARFAALPFVVEMGVDPRVDSQRFPSEVEGAVYYATCEAVTNAIKHSHGSKVAVELGVTDEGALEVTVADDGRGFDGAHERWSVPSLRDRVEGSGGTLHIAACEAEGTRVEMTFPLRVSND